MADLVEEGFDLTTLRGIGKELAKKITEIVHTGELSYLQKLKTTQPAGLETLLKIPGLGPKRVHMLHETLHIDSLQDLQAALKSGEVEKLPGFGPKLTESIARELEKRRYEEKRFRLFDAAPVSEEVIEALRHSRGLIEIEVAGSIRRRKETVHDIDIVSSCSAGNDIMERFTALPERAEILMKGPTRSSIVLKNGMQVDLRVVPREAYGAALHHFTGSRAHNIALRKLALKRGLKINEYGIFKEDKRISGTQEGDIYRSLKMAYVEPEMREHRGEIPLAQQGRLPKLITQASIRGDLHLHTSDSDGANSLREMALAARERGYEYIAITDHSRHLAIAHGLDERRIREQMEAIDRLNDELEGIVLLKSAEVDILKEGTLDLPDTLLRELDLVVCGIHTQLNLSEKAQTKRLLKAMENPYFSILAHPTGRLIGLRDPYAIEMETIMRACLQQGIILELNAQPDRLDLNDIHCKMAKEAGVRIAISTDAHSIRDLELMKYGIGQARRGWLEEEDVVNTRSLKALRKILKASRK